MRIVLVAVGVFLLLFAFAPIADKTSLTIPDINLAGFIGVIGAIFIVGEIICHYIIEYSSKNKF